MVAALLVLGGVPERRVGAAGDVADDDPAASLAAGSASPAVAG
jgi:hypothetical protein